MTVPISTFIDITTRFATAGSSLDEFGTGLLVTIDPGLPAGGQQKARQFSTAAAALAVARNDATEEAINVWFARAGVKRLYLMRWATTLVTTRLEATAAPAAVSALAQNPATFRIGAEDFSVDLSGSTSYTAIATALQTAIAAEWSGTTVAYANNAFSITFPDADEDEYGPLQPHSAGTATDISGLLRLDAASGALYLPGHNAETFADAVTEALGVITGGRPVALMLAHDLPTTVGTVGTIGAAAAYAQANNMAFGLRETAAAALVAGDTTSESALAYARDQTNVAAVYAIDDEYPEIGLMALMSSQNLDSPASVINPHAKTLSGVVAANITPTQLDELERKRVSVYTNVSGKSRFVGGYASADGRWLDAIWWLMWMTNRLEAAQWDAMGSARIFTPTLLIDEVQNVVDAGIANGGIEPGRSVNTATRNDIIATTGNREFDGVLTTGSVLWVDPNPTDADRTNRRVRWKLWVVGTQRINSSLGDLIFVS